MVTLGLETRRYTILLYQNTAGRQPLTQDGVRDVGRRSKMPYSTRAKYVHKRKINPNKFAKASFRVVSKRKGCVLVVVGCLKGHFHPSWRGKKKCDIGLRTQKVMYSKKCYPHKRGD